MRSVRSVVRTLIAGFLALAGPVLAAPAVLAHAQEVQQRSFRTDGASSHQLTVSIDAINHSFATPGSTVTVSGTISNDTGSPLRGVQVQLLTQSEFFIAREGMDSYAAGGTGGNVFPQPVGTAYVLTGILHSHTTKRWTASFTTAEAGYGTFGVFPLVAQAEFSDGVASGTDRTFLPYWPGTRHSNPLNYADPLNTAWVWPLIDQPQEGPCPQTLATNSLAASLGTGGRLGTLLAVGQRWAQQDHLTWAVDPALLSDVKVMTKGYEVNSNSRCKGGTKMLADAAAKTWLSSLGAETKTEAMFVTPYGDADVSALAHAGLAGNLQADYQLGESVARKILVRSFGITGKSTGVGGAPAAAWPTDGVTDASTLTSLASSGGISTVVLNSNELPPISPSRDDAITATTTGTGGRMGVLLADSGLTGILGSASASSPAGTQFAAEQDFLAETAMIVAQAPFQQRSLVIAPPRRWDPSALEAAKLLSETFSAPWLRKVSLANLATTAGRLKSHQSLPASQVRPAELGESYLGQVMSVDSNMAVYKDLLYKPAPALLQQLDVAAANLESSDWRGAGVGGGLQAVGNLSGYLNDNEKNVRIITGTKLLLGGSSGPAPVSVQNGGQQAVEVWVKVTVPANSKLFVGGTQTPLTIEPGKIGTLTMTVHSGSIGTTQMQLQLVTKNGSPLPWTSVPLSVQATRYGRALLVLIGAALGVLVLTSVARWIRRLNGGRASGRSGGTG
jgi:hypothetical protein